MLESTIIDLLSYMRSRTQVAAPLAAVSVTRYIALYWFDFFSLCRGYDLSVYIVVADSKVPSVLGV